jgi:hypothetical protein
MRLVLITSAVALAAGLASAGENLELRAAQMELKLAEHHLQRAARTHGGRRRVALEQTRLALYEVNQALKKVRLEDGVGRAPRTPPGDEDE